MNYKIALIKGDGIGPEIVDEAVKVLTLLSFFTYFVMHVVFVMERFSPSPQTLIPISSV